MKRHLQKRNRSCSETRFSDFDVIPICRDAKPKSEPLEGGNRADCYKIEYLAPILHTDAMPGTTTAPLGRAANVKQGLGISIKAEASARSN